LTRLRIASSDPTSPNGRGETVFAVTSRFIILFFPRPKIALAVIAAFGTPWRAEAARFFIVAGTRLFAASPLYQHAAALAIGDQAAFADGLERFFDT
jgi:hypothetical protein